MKVKSKIENQILECVNVYFAGCEQAYRQEGRSILDTVCHSSLNGFGTAAHEKGSCRKDVEKALFTPTEYYVEALKMQTLWADIVIEGPIAWYSGEIDGQFKIDGSWLDVPRIRATFIFRQQNEDSKGLPWRMMHLHWSFPDHQKDDQYVDVNTLQAYTESLEQKVTKRTDELKKALFKLKSTQDQLVQQEKLASLGQLTAGIAHEIKNPLNFVNNFSEVSVELVEEAREELTAFGDQSLINSEKVKETLEILDDIEANLKKIHDHGSRADGIVKSMLQHSRGGTGKMEPTDLNALVEEYVNLSFHSMQAGKNPINVDIEMGLDKEVEKVPVIAEDFSRVIGNLCNNAFDAMREKLNKKGKGETYAPKLSVRTFLEDNIVGIEIKDNGPGIPEEMKDKIFQPFFTTKKGTEGTGLGLSITNDVIKAHGGDMDIESKISEGSIFRIILNT